MAANQSVKIWDGGAESVSQAYYQHHIEEVGVLLGATFNSTGASQSQGLNDEFR